MLTGFARHENLGLYPGKTLKKKKKEKKKFD